MKPIARSATEKDLIALESTLEGGTARSFLQELLLAKASFSPNDDSLSISVMEIGSKLAGLSAWSPSADKEVVLNTFWVSDEAKKSGMHVRFLKREILAWAKKNISRVRIKLPESEALDLAPVLIACGFFHEGVDWSSSQELENSLRFGKRLIYESVPSAGLINFLRGLFDSLGYETRIENGALMYRPGAGYQPPFVTSFWHKIACQGPSLLVAPPARQLENHELETLFFPLVVEGYFERPLMVTLDRKRAVNMIETPREEASRQNLFQNDESTFNPMGRNLVYTFPTGFSDIRKGLPVLFYVNGVGSVARARIESWSFEDPRVLCKILYDDEKFDIDHVREHAGVSGPRAGKVLVLSYDYYRVFNRPVSLEEMKAEDNDFNPQRQRSISYEFLDKISARGEA